MGRIYLSKINPYSYHFLLDAALALRPNLKNLMSKHQHEGNKKFCLCLRVVINAGADPAAVASQRVPERVPD